MVWTVVRWTWTPPFLVFLEERNQVGRKSWNESTEKLGRPEIKKKTGLRPLGAWELWQIKRLRHNHAVRPAAHRTVGRAEAHGEGRHGRHEIQGRVLFRSSHAVDDLDYDRAAILVAGHRLRSLAPAAIKQRLLHNGGRLGHKASLTIDLGTCMKQDARRGKSRSQRIKDRHGSQRNIVDVAT